MRDAAQSRLGLAQMPRAGMRHEVKVTNLVFVVQSQNPEVSLQTIFKGVMPFLYADILLLLALVIYPPLATWLPSVL